MTAQILLDAAPGPKQLLAPGTVALTNFNDSGVLGWQWDLADKPPGSTAAIAAPNNASTVLNVDLPGSYLVRLRTYKDASRTIADGADSSIAYMRYSIPHTWRLPAAGETNEVDSSRGWAEEVNAILADIRAAIAVTTVAGKIFYTYVVGNALAGDTVADCNYLDPGDGSGIAAACAAAYSAPGVIILRRGVYTLPPTWIAPSVPASTQLRGEGAATVIVASPGDAATLPWRTFALGGTNASITDMMISIPDRDPLSLAPSSVLPVISVDALNTSIRRVTIEIAGNFAVADHALSCIHFSDPYFTLGGQVFEEVTLDMTYASVTGHAVNTFAAFLCSSGDFATPYAIDALASNRTEPRFVRCRVIGGKTDDTASPPYVTVGALHCLASEMTFVDCDLDGVTIGYAFSMAVPTGTIKARGPQIIRGTVRPAPATSGLFVQGLLLYASETGGTLTVDRVHVDSLKVIGPATGSVPSGIYITGNAAIHKTHIHGCDIESNSASTSLDATIIITGTAAMFGKTHIHKNVLQGSAGAFGVIEIDYIDSAIIEGNVVDKINIQSSCTDTNVSLNRVIQVAGITDVGVGTSQTGNV